MEGMQLISESRKKLLRLLLEDPRIGELVLVNGEKAASVVIKDDGSTTFRSIPDTWWAWLFRYGHKRTMSFSDLAFLIRDALARYTPASSRFRDAIKDEIVDHAIDSKNYDYVVDRLFLNAILGVTEGEYKLKRGGELRQPDNNSCKDQGTNYRRVGKTTIGIDLGGGCIPVDLYIEEKQYLQSKTTIRSSFKR